MKQTTVYIIFLGMVMSEKMFIIVSSFLFGYCVGYYSFELVKSKNRKYETHGFFLSYNKKNGKQCRIPNKTIGGNEN